jgi:transcriptional regulator with XRE-family HTH domain
MKPAVEKPDGGLPPELAALPGMFRDLRRDLGLNLRDAATAIGVSFNTLSRLERGKVPDAKNLIRVLTWLGYPLGWLTDLPQADSATPAERQAYWRGHADAMAAHRRALESLTHGGGDD